MNGTLTRDFVFFRLLRSATIGLLIVLAGAALISAQYCSPDQCDECSLNACGGSCCHEAPQLWVFNTRGAPRCNNLDRGFDCIKIKRWDAKCCRFVNETMESFLAQEASMPTMIYAHGNSLKHQGAMKQCWAFYEKLRCCPGKKRLVFWSWPAQRVFKTERLRVREMIQKNLRIKYAYAEYQGYYVAKLVQQMSLSQRVTIAGHSYGGITSAAALHWLGGGSLKGLTLEGGAPVERANLRGAIISGAFDSDMLYPGHCFGQAFVAVEKIYITRNFRDSTLRKWSKVSLRGCPAIGSVGVNAHKLGPHRHKLCQQTMTQDVRRSHYLRLHLKSTRFLHTLCGLSFSGFQSDFQAAKMAEGSGATIKKVDAVAKQEQLLLEAAG